MNILCVTIDEGDLIRVTEGTSDTILEIESYDANAVKYTLLGKNKTHKDDMSEFADWLNSADAVKVRN